MKTANLLNEKLELVTEISSLKLAVSKKTGFDLEGNKVGSILKILHCKQSLFRSS